MDSATFTSFPKLPLEIRAKIWELDLDSRPARLVELFIEGVPRPKHPETGIFQLDTNAIVVRSKNAESDTQLQVSTRVLHGTPMPGIVLACRESHAIAKRFNKERDKIIVMQSRLNRPPSGVSHIPGSRHHPIRWQEEAFKEAFSSAKHIASFVTAETYNEKWGNMRRAARRFYEDARLMFPQMETFTAISSGEILSRLWDQFTNEWQLQDERDAGVDGTLPPRPVNLLQDQSLMNSFIILDRRERHLKRKSSWEREKYMQNILEKRVTRAQTARKERKAANRRHDRNLFLRRHLGQELGAAEESIEWDLELKWWGLGGGVNSFNHCANWPKRHKN